MADKYLLIFMCKGKLSCLLLGIIKGITPYFNDSFLNTTLSLICHRREILLEIDSQWESDR